MTGFFCILELEHPSGAFHGGHEVPARVKKDYPRRRRRTATKIAMSSPLLFLLYFLTAAPLTGAFLSPPTASGCTGKSGRSVASQRVLSIDLRHANSQVAGSRHDAGSWSAPTARRKSAGGGRSGRRCVIGGGGWGLNMSAVGGPDRARVLDGSGDRVETNTWNWRDYEIRYKVAGKVRARDHSLVAVVSASRTG